MKQIIQNLRTGETTIATVPCPQNRPGHILIQTKVSLISPGTERMLVEFSKGNLIAKAKSQPEKVKQVIGKIKTDGLASTVDTIFKRLDEPLPLGYCNVGTIVHADTATLNKHNWKIGDRIASSGPHAEMVDMPKNLCAKIPADVSNEQAAFTVIGAIGLQGVRLATPTLGEKFVVFGAGLIGLIIVQLLQACGCEVMAVDLNDHRLELANAYGAETCNPANSDPIVAANAWTEGIGVDSVIITASAKTDEIVHQSASMCRKRGRIVLVGVVGLNLRRADFYEKELSFQVSCSYGPGRYDDAYEKEGQDYPIGYVRWTEQRNFQAILGMMESGSLDVTELITDRMLFSEAEKAYEKISNDLSSLGIILEYPETVEKSRTVAIETTASKSSGKCTLAMIGAGNFAKMTMGPYLAKTSARLKYVSARTNSVAASHIARKYGFEKATTDLPKIFSDSDVNTVFITTNHNSHAKLVCTALEAGKHTFVEKPLCITLDELKKIISVYNAVSKKADSAPPQCMVGFNRRFSPHIKKVKELLTNRNEPLAMHFSCNAGVIPPEAWVHDPAVGGGRIIGEACHFFDLLSYIANSRIMTVSAVQMAKGVAIQEDKMSIILSFEDGSIGSVNYFGNGSNRYPKERLEVFSEGRILRLDNFRKLKGYGFKRFRKFTTRTMDKGHQAEFQNFVNRVEIGGNQLIPFDDLMNVSLASFAAVTSAIERRMINLQEEFYPFLGDVGDGKKRERIENT